MSENTIQSGSAVRAAALSLFLEVNEENKYYNKVLHDTLEQQRNWEKQDRAFFTRLTNGVVEKKIFLDAVINRYSKTPIRKMRPVIRNLLRMGVYQILYLDQVPDHAACNETIKLAVKRGFGSLRGFLNGVLRTICREKEVILTRPSEQTPEECAIWYSVPLWMVALWWEQYGREKTLAMLRYSQQLKHTTIRVNTDWGSTVQYEKLLGEQGIEAEHGKYALHSLYLQGINTIERLPGYADGAFLVQDESSMLAGQCADVKPGMCVVDICAAPGGKTLYAAECLKDKGHVISRDVSEHKVARINENAKRMKLSVVKTQVWDATKTDDTLLGKADVVIADLPCSGLGVIGKKPDIKYRVVREDIDELQQLQRKILTASVGYLKPGGVLLYSTCTVNRFENDENVEWIESQFGLTRESLNPYLPDVLQSDETSKGTLQLIPGIHQCDGFYLARFRKGVN